MILQGDGLCAVWYCREMDSAQNDTAGRLTLRSMIPRKIRITCLTRRKLNQNRKHFKTLVSCPGRFEWWNNFVEKSRWTSSLRAVIAQFGEHQTKDLNVHGSIPGRGIILHYKLFQRVFWFSTFICPSFQTNYHLRFLNIPNGVTYFRIKICFSLKRKF